MFAESFVVRSPEAADVCADQALADANPSERIEGSNTERFEPADWAKVKIMPVRVVLRMVVVRVFYSFGSLGSFLVTDQLEEGDGPG
ncbi:hypothetical protein FNV62_00355 [Streptomyces sp. RLB3-17]|uniref:hypothetical protein n=1 Tax=Streptomyces TaxID=1883 RepID=UPI0011634FB2|nr:MULTISPECIES: hypothetical protein [Streptomyces]MCX4617300.1 hypothetical protein [Streptomyces mirabilis]QDN54369.1 hypothetical protein FNV67_02010 [Streptomyces sp. S1D4-20]QDN64551.1 hypothetical protein FNV66_01645 [Streptomyces sp. S1D4-14]QDN74868.1 hypothetical protein FNV64_03510 [Streptomyces sp. S1A1-7]QDN95065.1 hypothetical protein FNV58_01780 [Streptomyces sp. RLB1-9]